MSLRLQIIIIIFALIVLYTLFSLVRKKKIELKYALVWMVVGIVVLILACFPRLMDYTSVLIGIKSPINMVFFFGFCLICLVMMSLTVALSSTSVKVKNLIQKNAILEDEIKQCKKLLEENNK